MAAPEGSLPVVALVGPTAVGKTEAAVDLALAVGGEIVSADSVQVYRGMDVGTAKPSPGDRRGVTHHLIDLVDPGDVMTVGRFQHLARQVIADIHGRGRLPIVTGGTGLYLRAALGEWRIPPVPPDEAGRRRRQALAQREGFSAVWEELRLAFPERARRIEPRDLPRILRAFEVGNRTGEAVASPYHLLKVGLWRPRAEVYRRLEERAARLWAGGMVEEALSLVAGGLPRDRPPLASLGYREAGWYLTGRVTMAEARRLFIRNSRHFAKRQMTWWRREPVLWLKAEAAPVWLVPVVKAFLRGDDPLAILPREARGEASF